eukprot:CAMPEP_0171033244 /NCGR_PEP_ID=MMETSP0736-20130129/38854_1 /TAXON_ID=186038 /ORGANISM="Fragilariopsis kerguelensis, Strain L26-C5" /LENGTH=36 /DNA_ID= /DNA_START= /DNA_END= /DNA_ORIENTATION=
MAAAMTMAMAIGVLPQLGNDDPVDDGTMILAIDDQG